MAGYDPICAVYIQTQTDITRLAYSIRFLAASGRDRARSEVENPVS